MRHQKLRRAILQFLYERALDAPQSLVAGIETREIAHELGIPSRDFAFNALYLDGKGLITNDRSSTGSEHHYTTVMLTPAGVDAVENPVIMDRVVPLREPDPPPKRSRSQSRRG